MYASGMIAEIDAKLPDAPAVRKGGSLLMMVGLPGAGKTFVVSAVQKVVPCAVITTDRVRLHVRTQPLYTAAEMAYTYEICFGLIATRLDRGQRVVFDASNYLAARRRRLAEIAHRRRAALAICQVQASEEVTRRRLARRVSGNGHGSDPSEAGWPVYKWMVEAMDPVTMEHLNVDTTATPVETLAEQIQQYWVAREEKFDGNDNLQSAGRSRGHGHDH